jgi:hypothetical protein
LLLGITSAVFLGLSPAGLTSIIFLSFTGLSSEVDFVINGQLASS